MRDELGKQVQQAFLKSLSNSSVAIQATTEIALRDYFAGQALAGLVGIHADRRDHAVAVAAPRLAYEYADAMLAHRAKVPKGEGI